MKVLVTGATGMVGKGVLLECLDSEYIEKAVVVNRSPIDVEHEKLEEHIVKDFFDLSSLRGKLDGIDACYFCLGISSFRMSEEDFTRITYDLTMLFANELHKQSPQAVFCYVSGAGTNPNSRTMWSRVKGKTEDDLGKIGFKASYAFRPGFIYPKRGIKTKTALYSVAYAIFKPLYFIFRLSPAGATDTTSVGLAMINTARLLPENKILGNRLINEMAKAD